MDSKTLIKALKTAVREVIKEELTEILHEGLQSTINEMKMSSVKKRVTQEPVRNKPSIVPETQPVKNKVQFKSTSFANILNETPSMRDPGTGISSFAELVNEDIDTLSFTSADAPGFGMMRTNQQPSKPQTMHDPETDKILQVDPVVAKAITRDYSALMKAVDKKKGFV
jgi:hypothetical protein